MMSMGITSDQDQRCLLRIPVSRDDTIEDCLRQATHLPGCRATFRVTEQALLRHDWNGVTRRTTDVGEDLVPNVSLIFLLDIYR